MNIRQVRRLALAALMVGACAMPALAAENQAAPAGKPGSDVTWIHPVIPKFGGVHPRPDVDMQPDPQVDYKVFVDVVSTEGEPGKPFGSLDRLARLVNLMGYAKVPPSHVHIVALLDERAGMAALTDEAYKRLSKSHTGNPNLEIVHALKKAGVKLMVCSQAMAGRGLKDSEIAPDVTITLSGLTDPVIYGQRGYTVIRL